MTASRQGTRAATGTYVGLRVNRTRPSSVPITPVGTSDIVRKGQEIEVALLQPRSNCHIGDMFCVRWRQPGYAQQSGPNLRSDSLEPLKMSSNTERIEDELVLSRIQLMIDI